VRIVTRLVSWAGGFVVVAVLALLALHNNGSIQSDIWIERPPEDVWTVLAATSEYGAWNPMISRLSGELRAGNTIEFVEGSASDGMVFHPTILVAQPGRELTWKGHVLFPGIFDGEHSFILDEAGSWTHFIQRERFSGLLVGRLTKGILVETEQQMAEMNFELKKRVESR
jgi:hypothetical protein